jgi:DNA-binding response OmpR family regulator
VKTYQEGKMIMKILIVEDEANIRHILKYNLELDGHSVLLAENGQQALDQMSEKPELVLLDVMMPVLNGLETCKILKADPATKDIPVFMLTAKSQINDIEEAFRVGADDYLTKPFDPDALSERINTKLENFRKSKLDE